MQDNEKQLGLELLRLKALLGFCRCNGHGGGGDGGSVGRGIGGITGGDIGGPGGDGMVGEGVGERGGSSGVSVGGDVGVRGGSGGVSGSGGGGGDGDGGVNVGGGATGGDSGGGRCGNGGVSVSGGVGERGGRGGGSFGGGVAGGGEGGWGRALTVSGPVGSVVNMADGAIIERGMLWVENALLAGHNVLVRTDVPGGEGLVSRPVIATCEVAVQTEWKGKGEDGEDDDDDDPFRLSHGGKKKKGKSAPVVWWPLDTTLKAIQRIYQVRVDIPFPAVAWLWLRGSVADGGLCVAWWCAGQDKAGQYGNTAGRRVPHTV